MVVRPSVRVCRQRRGKKEKQGRREGAAMMETLVVGDGARRGGGKAGAEAEAVVVVLLCALWVRVDMTMESRREEARGRLEVERKKQLS